MLPAHWALEPIVAGPIRSRHRARKARPRPGSSR